MKVTDRQKVEVLLTEYSKAQDSAQHFDTLIWTVSSIFFVGYSAILGFVLTQGESEYNLILRLIGALSLAFLLLIINSHKKYKDLKYNRCKEIERMFGMKQHTITQNGYIFVFLQIWIGLLAFLLFLVKL